LSYACSLVISAGPWLATILMLYLISFQGAPALDAAQDDLFKVIVTYNFAFSFLLTSPIAMPVSRYIADQLFSRNIEVLPSAMLAVLGFTLFAALLVSGLFYGVYAEVSLPVAAMAIMQFVLLCAVWITTMYLSALKDFLSCTLIFVTGVVISLLALFFPDHGPEVRLACLNIGFAFTFFALMAKIFAEYPATWVVPAGLLSCFRKYWQLMLSGLFYAMGIWVDKWVMWLAPERQIIASSFVIQPLYEGALQLAQLFIIPSLALYMLMAETSFYRAFFGFHQAIREHKSLRAIQAAHEKLRQVMGSGARNMVLLQATLCFALIALLPMFFSFLHMDLLQIGIFRLSVLAVFFHALLIAVSTTLNYFDLRGTVLSLNILFFVLNGVGTYVTLLMDYQYRGYGYFIAALVTFFIGAIALMRATDNLIYLSFVRTNESVR
jgi:uncharacterized membrane protein